MRGYSLEISLHWERIGVGRELARGRVFALGEVGVIVADAEREQAR